MIESGPLGGGHKTLEAKLFIAKLERFAALGDILLLLGQVRHSLYSIKKFSSPDGPWHIDKEPCHPYRH